MASAAPTAASARDGLIVVRERITLTFPVPGVYKGKVLLLEAKIKRAATRGKSKANTPKDKDRARATALNACRETISKRQVTVLHLSKPPFRIGVDMPRENGGYYRVSGPQPPKGDPVKAFQSATSRRVRTANARLRYRWRVKCQGAQVTKPYPY